MDPQQAFSKAITVLGGYTATAAVIGAGVKRQNVKHWEDRGHCPSDHAPVLQKATREAGDEVTCEQLCPAVRWDLVRGEGAASGVTSGGD